MSKDPKQPSDSGSVASHCSSPFTLVAALRVLASDIQSDDGVANSCIAEAADRMEELIDAVRWLHSALHQTNSVFVPSTDGACRSNAIALRATAKLVEESRHPTQQHDGAV